MSISYSIKPPDMSRNMALAGKTVSSRGMNVTYDEQGYAVKAVNYKHKLFEGTEKGVPAASIESVLAGVSDGGGEPYAAAERAAEPGAVSARETARAVPAAQEAVVRAEARETVEELKDSIQERLEQQQQQQSLKASLDRSAYVRAPERGKTADALLAALLAEDEEEQ